MVNEFVKQLARNRQSKFLPVLRWAWIVGAVCDRHTRDPFGIFGKISFVVMTTSRWECTVGSLVRASTTTTVAYFQLDCTDISDLHGTTAPMKTMTRLFSHSCHEGEIDSETKISQGEGIVVCGKERVLRAVIIHKFSFLFGQFLDSKQGRGTRDSWKAHSWHTITGNREGHSEKNNSLGNSWHTLSCF